MTAGLILRHGQIPFRLNRFQFGVIGESDLFKISIVVKPRFLLTQVSSRRWGSGEPAYVLAKQAMKQLGCNSADAFFLLMRDNPDAYGKEWYLKESSTEHKNLRAFITSALSKPYPFRGLQ